MDENTKKITEREEMFFKGVEVGIQLTSCHVKNLTSIPEKIRENISKNSIESLVEFQMQYQDIFNKACSYIRSKKGKS